ncbi:M48 family metallopeptidase [Sphingomonas albertensis]|uniref:Peptidase M48 family protein n=1 Tax=Sphingomonas albertensis TaxID=2762591 RepID=A0ABR7AMF6_9SPHN|nr:M48 family metallopeptidase [Sphingomonas albertensis]MBC3941645.1 peptidase M48 family protein [Sphingomonas albertensis]
MSMIPRLLPLLLLTAASPAKEVAPSPAFFETLRAADLRLATIAYRLTTANAALCDRQQPQIGMPIHALTQYGPAARPSAATAFGFESTVGVEAVVPGAPADRAGLRANDSIVAINDTEQPGLPGADATEGARARDAAEAVIAAAPIAQPLRLTILRGGKRLPIAVQPVAGCRSRFEILLGSGLGATADGAIVQIGERFFEDYTDEEIAVVVSHELAHNILRHRDRLDAAKINRGMLAELGRNGRLIRETEDQADLLGIYLLANAGYDPMSAPKFWRQKGGTIDGGLFRSRTHASSKARAEVLEAAAREIAATPTRPIIPPVVATRDVPLR